MVACAALGERMTRLGLILNVSAGVVLATTLVAAELDRRDQPWRGFQQRYQKLLVAVDEEKGNLIAQEGLRPHQVEMNQFGALDRCTTCHLGLEPGARGFDDEENSPFGSHPDGHVGEGKTLHGIHPIAEVGCTSCHGGQGRALHPDKVHDQRHEQGGWSAFTHPRERCSRCHAQGGHRSKRGQRGAEVYLAQGCAGCHQPGRTGPGIGPDLASIGLRGRDYLEQVLLRPDEVYPETIMPPLRFVFDEEREDLEALLTLLQGFEPWPREDVRRPRSFDPRLCTNCHRLGERAWPPVGEKHNCSYLEAESAWLRCDRCHGEREAAHDEELPTPTMPSKARPAEAAEGEAAQATINGKAQPGKAPAQSGQMESIPGVDEATPEVVRTLPAAPALELDSQVGSCPFLETSFSTCGICHREGER